MSEMEEKDVRMWSMFCHLAALAGLIVPFGNLIGPLVVWLVKKQDHPTIDENGKESLNFQISASLYLFMAGIVAFVLTFACGLGVLLFPVIALAGIGVLILAIIAGVKANNGQSFKYPITIRFIS